MAGRQFNENNANVPSQDATDNVQERDVVGNKTDTSAAPSGTTSLVAITKKIYDEVVSMSDASELFGKSGPSSVEIDDDATYALELYDVGDTVPTTAEITPGNYQIDRVRNAALTNIVASTPASEATGKIYCSEVFSTVAGWAVGDLVLVTFSGGSIVQGGATTVLPNAYFYSRITREEDIEDKIDVIDGYHDVPSKDSTDDAQIRDVVGKKEDDAQTAVGTTRSIIAYIKGLLNQVAKIPKSDAAVTWNSTALQSIQDEAEDALEGENLDHLQAVTTVAADMTAEVADGSVISRMLSKTSDTSTYDPTTDAQEMISDKLGGFSGDGGAAQDDSTKASLDLAHTDLDAIIVGTITNATAADVATDVVGMRTAADNGYEDMINIVGEGGHVYTAEAATEPGDDVSIMGGLRYVSDMIKKAGGMGGGVATKTLTFTNDGAGTLALFTVTGDVIVKIIATCGTLVASAAAANVEVGIPADTDGIISTTVATDIDAGEVWHDATPDSGLEALSTMREYIIANGADIGIKLSGQVDSGVITFHCIWTGLNGGIVVAA